MYHFMTAYPPLKWWILLLHAWFVANALDVTVLLCMWWSFGLWICSILTTIKEYPAMQMRNSCKISLTAHKSSLCNHMHCTRSCIFNFSLPIMYAAIQKKERSRHYVWSNGNKELMIQIFLTFQKELNEFFGCISTLYSKIGFEFILSFKFFN